jgi:hypothetical protein
VFGLDFYHPAPKLIAACSQDDCEWPLISIEFMGVRACGAADLLVVPFEGRITT